MGAIDDRLGELGLALPAPMAAPAGVRLPFETVRVHGGLAYVSGHGPFDGERPLVLGRVGAEVSVEQGVDDSAHRLRRRQAGREVADHHVEKVLPAEELTVGRAGLDDAVGVQQESVAGLELLAADRRRRAGREPLVQPERQQRLDLEGTHQPSAAQQTKPSTFSQAVTRSRSPSSRLSEASIDSPVARAAS